jgi:hypothetical protein
LDNATPGCRFAGPLLVTLCRTGHDLGRWMA